MNKVVLNRPIYEFNSMTPKDAIEEIKSWDFEEVFGGDAERLSDAIKRLDKLIQELSFKKKNGLVLINETLGIYADIKFLDQEHEMYKEIHFYDSNCVEFYANLGDYPGAQDHMEEEINILSSCSAYKLVDFIHEYDCIGKFTFANGLILGCNG